MAKDKNRDKVAGPDDLTIQGLYDLACQSTEDLEAPDTIAADILNVMVNDDSYTDWNSKVFPTCSGITITALVFLKNYGNATPVTRTLSNYIQPLVASGAVTTPRLGGRVITRSADPALNFDSVKNLNAGADQSDFGCTCC